MLCDPWFTPAYFGSWFPFPRNDGLDSSAELGLQPDYLYISHLHRDHFDPEWLARNVSKQARVLLPEFGIDLLARELRALGFHDLVRTTHGERLDLDGLGVTILAMTSPADGPLGDSAIVLDDGSARVLNQNDARPGDLDALHALGPFDAQLLQFSGAIWYPIAYDFPAEEKERLARAKRIDEMERAERYVEGGRRRRTCSRARDRRASSTPTSSRSTTSTATRPTSSPTRPCSSSSSRRTASTARTSSCPARSIELDGGACTVTHPSRATRPTAPFAAQARVPRAVPARLGRLARGASGRRGPGPVTTSSPSSAAWFEPLLEQAPITSAGVAGNVVLDVGDPDANVCIDFVESKVRPWRGEPYVYKVDVDRALIETLVDDHVEDWVNSLFLSCRFTAHRDGPFNEFVLTFFKGALARAHGLRRAVPSARRADAPTSSSNATAGASNAGARTARPTSPASARSTTACSRAASTTGASISRPAAASRATTATSAANA